MNNTGDTKSCPLCAETIRLAAKVCPYCGTKQKQWGAFGIGLQELGVVIATVFVTLPVVFLVVKAESLEGQGEFPGRSFARHRDDLVIVSSSVEGHPRGSEIYHYVTGVVSNRSEHAWRVHQLELRVASVAGLVDVRHLSVREPFVVQPGRDHAFRVDVGELAATNAEFARTVRVHAASDGERSPRQ